MATIYARIPDELYNRLNAEARTRELTITACTRTLIEAALDRADRERKMRDNRGEHYRDTLGERFEGRNA